MKLRLFGKHRWVFIILDMLTLSASYAFFYSYISSIPIYITPILIACLVSWIWLYNFQKISFDYYAHATKIFSGMLIFSLIYLHAPKNLTSLLIMLQFLCTWLLFSLLTRAAINKLYLPEIHLLTLTYPSEELAKNKKIVFTVYNEQIRENSLDRFDALIIDRNREFSQKTRNFIGHTELSGIPVITSNQLEEALCTKVSSHVLDQAWLYNGFKTNKVYNYIKRPLETLFIIIFSPIILFLLLLSALTVAITMGRPILFKQKRAGQDGVPFTIYKLRTMINGCSDRETSKNDTRITPAGKILRKTRLDEFPQFLNVLKGEMSLIGPRPEWVITAEKFNKEIPAYHLRQLVKPGITGHAQVHQGHTTGEKGNYEKQQYDLYYVKHFSFILDLKIFIKTLVILYTGSGAK